MLLDWSRWGCTDFGCFVKLCFVMIYLLDGSCLSYLAWLIVSRACGLLMLLWIALLFMIVCGLLRLCALIVFGCGVWYLPQKVGFIFRVELPFRGV